MNQRELEIINLLKKEVKPALGCTEPIAVALAVATARETINNRCIKASDSGNCVKCNSWLHKSDYKIHVEVSGNILKNGMGVGIPGTGMVGLDIAAALGAICGNSKYGLEVLKDIDSASIEAAKEFVTSDKVKITLADTEKKLYIKARILEDCGHYGEAIIADGHDNIVKITFDNFHTESELENDYVNDTDTSNNATPASNSDTKLTIAEICDFVDTIAFEDIEFILKSKDLNLALAEEGLNGDYGLCVGKTLLNPKFTEIFGGDFMSYAMAMTAAASDARMAGSTLPAMSNSGSGNQGITVTMPIISYALKYNTADEELARALTLAHLVAIHIKTYLGKLSALCGCVIASTGAACGLVYLKGGSYDEICSAIKNMVGNITGMICDGAKVGCAMKVASGVSSAIQSAVLAMEGSCISEHEGIIEKDIEKTIQNLGRIGSIGMQNTDNMILDIMVCK